MGVNSLPKTVTRQRRGCDLSPGPCASESSTLTTLLPSHRRIISLRFFTKTRDWSCIRNVTSGKIMDRYPWWWGVVVLDTRVHESSTRAVHSDSMQHFVVSEAGNISGYDIAKTRQHQSKSILFLSYLDDRRTCPPTQLPLGHHLMTDQSITFLVARARPQRVQCSVW